MVDKCKIPLDTLVICNSVEKHKLVKYLIKTGVKNPRGYVGSSNENIGRSKDNIIEYDNIINFSNKITWEEFQDLINNKEEQEFQYSIF